MIILGIDPSVRQTGYGILAVDPKSSSIRALDFGSIKNASKLSQPQCLVEIHQKISDLIETYSPTCAAMEGIIYVQNRSTAISLGAARGAALLAVAQRGLPIYEYAPRAVKKASTGWGGAAKTQVGFMMRAILGLKENPDADACDALALALAHAQSTRIQSAASAYVRQLG